MQPRLNRGIQPFWVKGTQIVPSSCTLAGFAIGALRSVAMPPENPYFRGATLELASNLRGVWYLISSDLEAQNHPI